MIKYDTSQIHSREDFVQFLQSLHDEYKSNGQSWENNNLERFLEAFSAYADDIPGYYSNNQIEVNADTPSWRVFADILIGSTLYE